MGIFPVTPLVRRVQALILATFDVTEQQAQDCAAELVALAEGWGSREAAESHDWDYRIRKDLGETGRLRWRSHEDRERFELAEKQKYIAYDAFIDTKYRA
jgi:hypothetical protein